MARNSVETPTMWVYDRDSLRSLMRQTRDIDRKGTKMVRESHRVSIRTKYLGPTNYRGSRIRVWRGDSSYREDANSLEVSWDYSADVSENHSAAVSAYVGRAGWDGQWVCGATESGCVAVWVGDQS